MRILSWGLPVGLAVALLAALPAHAATLGQSEQVIDNDQVTVWDIHLKPGQTGPSAPADEDAVILYVEGGSIKSDSKLGTTTMTHDFGDSVFVPKGQEQHDTLIKAQPGNTAAHEVLIALKNGPTKTIPNNSGFPPAWPRPGAIKTLDNTKVAAWYYDWLPGRPAPMHFHAHQQVVVFRYDGVMKSIDPDGKVTEAPHKAGSIGFVGPGKLHSEEYGSGKLSATLIELK